MKCETYWGSHGCGIPAPHEGKHVCLDEDGEECISVDDQGDDGSGFKWHMYGFAVKPRVDEASYGA